MSSKVKTEAAISPFAGKPAPKGIAGGKRDASTRRRVSLHTGEPRRVQWASRRAREVQQRAAGELIDGFATCVISNSCAWQK
jgi:hypothetical protein